MSREAVESMPAPAPPRAATSAHAEESVTESVVALTVLDPAGGLVPEPAFYAPRPETRERVRIEAVAEGDRWILTLGLPQRVSVEARGFRTLDVEVHGARVLVLEHGIPVSVRIAEPLPALPAGWSLSGELVRRVFGVAGAEDRRRMREPRFALDGGRAELRIAEPGSYLFAFVVHSSASEVGGSSFWNEPQAVLDVRDDVTPQEFVLAAPDASTRAEIQAFLEQRGGRAR